MLYKLKNKNNMNNFLSFDQAKHLAKSYTSTENWSKKQTSHVDEKFLTFEEAKVATQKLNLKGNLEWQNYLNSGLKS